jgi:hypothetical protein
MSLIETKSTHVLANAHTDESGTLFIHRESDFRKAIAKNPNKELLITVEDVSRRSEGT